MQNFDIWGLIKLFFTDLAELRKKFELDKKRLQDLKSKRTFRPF